MQEQESGTAVGRRVLRLAPGFDPGGIKPSSVEFFLLSRIDGRTPWRVLREMGGMSVEESDLCLESWLAAGFVEVCHSDCGDQGLRRSLSCEGSTKVSDSLRVDPSLDLDLQTQRRVTELLGLLEGPDALLLGVSDEANEKDLKRAYFKLSREFHPDRYFRRNLGPYRNQIEIIFKGIQKAYENLSRPPLASSVVRDAVLRKKENGISSSDSGHSQDESTPGDFQGLRSEREQRARELMRAAAQAISQNHFSEARRCLEIVADFEPETPFLRQTLAHVRSRSVDPVEAVVKEEVGQSLFSSPSRKSETRHRYVRTG